LADLQVADALFRRLVAAAAEPWGAYIRHNFVDLLATGVLPETCFRRYLVQDYLFLLHFARAWGLAIYKSDTLPEMRRAQRLVAATLDVEIGLHIDYCRGWGLSEAMMAAEPEALATIAYTRFVLDRGLAGDRLDLETALAPCVIGYGVIAAERITDPGTRLDGNPYREWLEMYAGADYQELVGEAKATLDEQFARRGGDGRFPALAATFATAARLEADFWQMGLDAAASPSPTSPDAIRGSAGLSLSPHAGRGLE
jgi:thiaminase/transcriptional activator TenA